MQEGNNRGTSTLLRLLDELGIPGKHAERDADGEVVIVGIGGTQSYLLRPMWVGHGQVADVRRRKQELLDHEGRPTPVAVGDKFTKPAIQWLEDHRISWLDEQGNARLIVPPALAIVQRRDVRGGVAGVRWSSTSGRMAEHLLELQKPHSHEGRHRLLPPAATLANTLAMSPPQVSRILQMFDREGWTRKEGSDRGPGSQRVVADPSALLSSWARWQSKRQIPAIRGHATWQDPHEFASKRLAPLFPHAAWELTGWLAADRMAPLVTNIPTITCYLDPNLFDTAGTSVLRKANIRQVDSGARVIFLRADPGQLQGTRINNGGRSGGLPLSSAVRVYADLLAAGARGEEAATHLRETVIEF